MKASLSALVSELQRRRVFRVAAVYAVVAWVVVEVSATIFPALQLPEWTVTLVVILAVLGFPAALALAWAFDITPAGVERTPTITPSPAPAAADAGHASAPPAPAGAGGTVRVGGIVAPKPPPRAPARGPIAPRTPERAGAAGDPPAGEPPQAAELQPPDPERVKRASLAHLRHELRTPVNAILGYSEMLGEDAREAGEQELLADLEKIRAAGRQLLSLIDRILHPDRIAATAAEQDLEAFGAELRHELRTPITAVIGYTEMLIESAREQHREDLLPDLQRILDAARQLLGHLDDIVRLSAAEAPQPAAGGELSRVTVMAQEVLAKIQPLPVASAADAEIGQASLLVVDDNPTNRDLLSRQLARQGFSVSTAENGREALEMIEAQDFDLVLLDIMMPEIDGVEVLRRLKGDPAHHDLPVIMISALDEVASVVRCLEMGARDYLTKPFDPVLLRTRIGASLELRRAHLQADRLAEQLRGEQDFSDRLLLSLMPATVAGRIRAGESAIADARPEVTVLSAELEGCGRLISRNAPAELVAQLSEVFAGFEQLAQRHDLEVFRVSGLNCTAVAGLPTARDDHTEVIAELALELVEATQRFAETTGEPLRIRIGVHCGPAVAGVLATEHLTYGVWGDAVETAARIRAQGTPGAIQVTPAVHSRLRDRYQFENRGVIEVSGKGQMRIYLLRDRAAAVAG
jgi:adenylate cyclase